MDFTPPAKDCRLCERLCSFREANRLKFPSYHNAPVEPFGSLDAEILIVGLAPGLNGANQTNRPITKDYAAHGTKEADISRHQDPAEVKVMKMMHILQMPED